LNTVHVAGKPLDGRIFDRDACRRVRFFKLIDDDVCVAFGHGEDHA
jgi:hypothetical protein